MSKHYLLLLFFVAFYSSAQNVVFTDTIFKARLTTTDIFRTPARDINGYPMIIDANRDGEIQITEALAVYTLYAGDTYELSVTNVMGLESFTNLITFRGTFYNLQALDVSSLVNLQELSCGGSQLSSLNVTGLQNLKRLYCTDGNFASLNLSGTPALELLDCGNNHLTSIDLSGHPVLNDVGVYGNLLTSLDVTGLPGLRNLNCSFNTLMSLNVTNLSQLRNLECYHNALTTINLTGLTSLEVLLCDHNQLTGLDITGLTSLASLVCSENQITSLDFSEENALNSLNCPGNAMVSLDVSGCHNLALLDCGDNLLTMLDVSNNPDLRSLSAIGNQLTYVNLKNGVIPDNNQDYSLHLSGNQNLQYICIDEEELQQVTQAIYSPGCIINSYCTFVPGGENYTVTGSFTIDVNNNGYDSSDPLVPGQSVSVNGTRTSMRYIANTSGTYALSAPPGSITLQPQSTFGYYNAEPATVTIALPGVTNPVVQNFSLSPIGPFNDLQVSILPITAARPGFDASYRICYKNVGTTILSGTLTLQYEDAVMDYVSASLQPQSAGNGLITWNYSNLRPFDVVYVDVVLNLNSPVETPAVSIGDQLNLSVIINPVEGDEKPGDNTHAVKQTVVGAYDPNDKVCAEGATITPDVAEGFITYVIRFENTGNYPAENVVVKDLIDPNKFDVTTLEPVNGSHSFTTRITTGNKVEFIFEHIQLPGTPDNDRHGFVAFRIKTLPGLQVGDTFSNTAAIYFDYNAPVITNEAFTTVALLGTTDYKFNAAVTLFPNPVTNRVQLSYKNGFNAKAINVYNTLGQLVLSIPNAQNTESIDVAALSGGNYFIKISNDTDFVTGRFIKK